MADEDWDLFSIVRNCTHTTASMTTTTTSAPAPVVRSSISSSTFHPFLCNSSSFSLYDPEQISRFLVLPTTTTPSPPNVPLDSFGINPMRDELLHDIINPFLTLGSHPHLPPLPLPPSLPNVVTSSFVSTAPFSSITPLSLHFQQQQQQQQQRPLPSFSASTGHSPSATPRIKRSRIRNNKQVTKNICQVEVAVMCPDVWSWRKYGQKLIKSSPYPRGYYKCSISKTCMARKLVERNKSNPEMFIVTYMAEHNHQPPAHRKCVAGTNRHNKSSSSLLPLPEKPCLDSCLPITLPRDDDQLLVLHSTIKETEEEDDFIKVYTDEELGNDGGSTQDTAPDDDLVWRKSLLWVLEIFCPSSSRSSLGLVLHEAFDR